MDCKLDLKKIALKARNAEYNPKVFISSLLLIFYRDLQQLLLELEILKPQL